MGKREGQIVHDFFSNEFQRKWKLNQNLSQLIHNEPLYFSTSVYYKHYFGSNVCEYSGTLNNPPPSPCKGAVDQDAAVRVGLSQRHHHIQHPQVLGQVSSQRLPPAGLRHPRVGAELRCGTQIALCGA